jgi:hypothetical protein
VCRVSSWRGVKLITVKNYFSDFSWLHLSVYCVGLEISDSMFTALCHVLWFFVLSVY